MVENGAWKMKIYIGDSVYAEYEGFGIVLTTENGYHDDPRNRIVLEPDVYENLIQFIEGVKDTIKTLRERQNEKNKQNVH